MTFLCWWLQLYVELTCNHKSAFTGKLSDYESRDPTNVKNIFFSFNIYLFIMAETSGGPNLPYSRPPLDSPDFQYVHLISMWLLRLEEKFMEHKPSLFGIEFVARCCQGWSLEAASCSAPSSHIIIKRQLVCSAGSWQLDTCSKGVAHTLSLSTLSPCI